MSTEPELRMVVVNVATWPSDFAEHRMYCCPATENGFHKDYRHYPARYIGDYVSKGVRYIAVVDACVRLNRSGPDEVLWKFGDLTDEDAIARSEEARAATNRNQRPCLVFLQGNLSRTEFVYDPLGGLQSSRVYFDLTDLAPKDVKDLAGKLCEVPWTALAKWRA